MSAPRRHRSRIVIAGLVAGILFAGSASASAYWSASNTHAGTSVAGYTAAAPTTISCVNQSILLVSVARVSWTSVAGATGYRVVVTRASGGTPVTVDQTATSIDLSSGVLGDLLTGLLAPTVLTVRVAPTFSAGNGIWVSSNSKAHTANAAVLPIGTTCGAAVTP